MERTEDLSLIAQGAEARVTRIRYLGQNAVLKTRLSKAYRHPDLDEALTVKRIISETRTVAKLRKNGIPVPLIYLVDPQNRHIVYEFIKGETITAAMKRCKGNEKDDIMEKVGTIVAKMHDVNVIHGDLTPRNMMRTDNGDIYLIDFGLSFVSPSVEDKGVDLYVLERCCEEEEFNKIMEAYGRQSKNGVKVTAKLAEVRLRGRKRDQTG
ncbi:non-specific serine/threonine protein kinase like protein [Babesia gibsoni]|uniref:non-specific serine/threonine protein kinase n=1 Tax=Babesia gibsoni TaxID=33632 RepID=A0AAD8PGF2_BABGI|nr:non-specific serine/threonine protein kinase like protein [Babesia gibsoni]